MSSSGAGWKMLFVLCLLAGYVQGLVQDASPYVVTSVDVVLAVSAVEAVAQCSQDLTGNAVGASWGLIRGQTVQLCQHRQRLDAIKPSDTVLQRILVLSSQIQCPSNMQRLVVEASSFSFCVQYALAQDAIAWGNYIVDLAVTIERNYNNEGPGWRTLPTSVRLQEYEDPYNRTFKTSGVYLSFRRPVLPIRAIRVLNDLHPDRVYAACSALYGPEWQQAGDGMLDRKDSSGQTVLCVQHGDVTTGLLDLKMAETSTSCPSGFGPAQALTSTLVLCSRWGNVDSTTPFLADINLVRIASSSPFGTDPTRKDFIPGSYDLVDPTNLNAHDDAKAFLFIRKVHPQHVPVPSPSKSSLYAVEHRNDASNTGTLSFKIMQLADLHITGNPNQPCRQGPKDFACTEATMLQWIADLLDVERPDFVVFTGDNVQTDDPKLHSVAMDNATQGVESKGIPYAMVIGNHDDENGFTREQLIDIAVHKPHSYTQRGPSEIPGVGNYELNVATPVTGPWGPRGTGVFRMYFLDSHSYPDKSQYPNVSATYDWVRPSQIEYYKQLSAAHEGNLVPALMFFHIPLVEYAADPANRTSGEHNEQVSPSDVSTNLFSTLVDRNEVKAVFVGHDHLNEYCTKREGIQLCYGGGAGLGLAYGKDSFARRVRLIEWRADAKGKRTITSWKRHFGDMAHIHTQETIYSETE